MLSFKSKKPALNSPTTTYIIKNKTVALPVVQKGLKDRGKSNDLIVNNNFLCLGIDNVF